MSYELFNLSITLCRKFSRQFWGKALELAHAYGWQPLGTCPPPHMDLAQQNAEWNGNYATNDGQIIRAEDARDVVKRHKLGSPGCRAFSGI